MGVATLPTTLQAEWNTQTRSQKGVPPVSELIAFMRDRSDALSSLTKKGDSHKVQKGVGLTPHLPTRLRLQCMW